MRATGPSIFKPADIQHVRVGSHAMQWKSPLTPVQPAYVATNLIVNSKILLWSESLMAQTEVVLLRLLSIDAGNAAGCRTYNLSFLRSVRGNVFK